MLAIRGEYVYCCHMAELDVPRIIPFTDIRDFESVAIDLNDLLLDPTNEDIGLDFKTAKSSYTGDPWRVAEHLAAVQASCELGVKEQFIVFAGPRAVGMSIVTTQTHMPKGVNPKWPNVSGFVCNPYRGHGIGRLSLERLLESVHENFGGHAWTEVRVDNILSQRLVTSAAFIDTNASQDPTKRLYIYGEEPTKRP
jgi:L-amino acid N-acyltransferase YncA